MKKTFLKILAVAVLMTSLTASAGDNPGKSILGDKPLFETKKPAKKSAMKLGDSEHSNAVIKINLSQIGLKNPTFQAEYGFHKKMSGALSLAFLLKRTAPSFFADDDPTGVGLRNSTIKGFAITPEFRFYPKGNDDSPAPHGFYIGAYLRHAKYSFNSYASISVSSGKTYAYNLDAAYKGTTVGLMIGRQWIIGKHFSIDWWIIGGGYGKAKFTMDAVGSGFIMSDQDQAEVKTKINKEVSDVPLPGFNPTNVKTTTTTNSASTVLSGLPMLGVRGMGLCLGFAF